MKLSSIDPKKNLRIALIGVTGVGKSAAAGSFYKAGPILFQDFDGRMKGVRAVHPNADIDYDTYGPGQELNTIFKPKMNALLRTCPWKTLVIDSLTSLSMTCITTQLILRGDGGKSSKGGLPVTGWDEINGETAFISQILDVARSLPCHLIMTFHPILRTQGAEGKTEKVETVACYGNKINQIALNYFDEVYYLDIEKGFTDKDPMKRVAYTTANHKALAKTALGLPPKMDITSGLYDVLMSYLN